MIILSRRYEMESAHQLTDGVPANHKCRRLHGHRYILTVRISGEAAADGMLVEYAFVDAAVMPVVKLCDHHSLNTLNERCSTKEAAAVAKNPTVELLIGWFAARLALLASVRSPGADLPSALRLESLTLEEDSRSSVEWLPDAGGSRE